MALFLFCSELGLRGVPPFGVPASPARRGLNALLRSTLSPPQARRDPGETRARPPVRISI
ncbi:hypothetical protein T484DRAFT_1988306, partial [Baffinella frigidus]